MTPVSIITKHIASPWSDCPKCGARTHSIVDVDAENNAERLIFSCAKCGPVKILFSTPEQAARENSRKAG